MILFLLVLQAVFVSVIVLFTVSFLIASINEKEPRAALLAGAISLLLIGVELCIYWLYTLGFFSGSAGLPLLLAGWVVVGYGIYFFGRHSGTNRKALKGVDGQIVGEAQRFDERQQVFARERSIRPGSAQ
jgi:predicted tellurium resistance membrane protein TerC